MNTTIAAAQIRLREEDIHGNLQEHYRMIRLAADHGVKLIAFPEMSITGYLKESAKKYSFTEDDSRLDKIRELAVDNDMIIIAGAPIKLVSALHIGSFVLFPDRSVLIYTKQFLHTGEDEFYTASFDHNPVIKLDDEIISLAICADIDNPLHPENAKKTNCTMYVASIFFSQNAIAKAHDLLSHYAKKHSMNVLMSNYGESLGRKAGGRSSLWSENGDHIAGLDTETTGLVIGRKNKDGWSGMIIKEE